MITISLWYMAHMMLGDKRLLWDYLSHVSNQWAGEVVMMGDFNEVRYKSDRFGSNFNAHGADIFNNLYYYVKGLKRFLEICPVDDTNAMRTLSGKLKFLKLKIQSFAMQITETISQGVSVTNFQEELTDLG
ncbi:hypothetical protein Tco_0059035 [Tanacetum coccineum]